MNSFVIAVLLVAGLLRLGANDFDRELIWGDETTYKVAATALLDCGTLIKDVEGAQLKAGRCNPTPALSPGFPAFIAAVYFVTDRSDKAALLANFALSLLTVLGAGMVARSVARSNIAGVVAMILVALYPGLIYNVDRLLTEQLFCALLVWSFYGLASWLNGGSLGKLLVGGLLLFSACHVRAQAAPVVLLTCALLVLNVTHPRKIKLLGILSFLGIGAVLFIPWAIRNYLQFSEFIPLTAAGEGPKIWGAVPYYLDMGSTSGRSLDVVERANSLADTGVYLRWRVLGYTNLMFGDVWDEKTVHLPWWTQSLLWVHAAGLSGLALSPLLLAKQRHLAAYLLVGAALMFFWTGMPYHGLPRYALPILLLALCIAGVLVQKAITALMRNRASDDDVS